MSSARLLMAADLVLEQYGIGVQHQLMPRVSAEVSFHKRWYTNFELTDDRNRSPIDYHF